MAEVAPAPTGSRLATWLTPARVVAFAVLGSIPAKQLGSRLADPDLWWHLQTGELIARNRAIPEVDPFSFTAAGKPWVVQEWGAELALHSIREAFGLYGIIAFRAVLLLAVYAILARILVRRMGTGMGTWALLGLAAYAGSPNWTERPNLLSFLLFIVTLDLIERRGRAIWWFLPLAAVWANLHGMVILGIGLVAVVAVTEALKSALGWEGADRAWGRRLAAVTVLAVPATFLNPSGPGLLSHSFGLIGTVQGFVSEWQSPSFHQAGPIVFLVLVVLVVAGLALNPSRPDPTDVALTLAFLVLALQAARNLAVAGMVLGLVGARAIPGALASLPRRAAPRREVGGRSSVALGALGLLLAAGGLGAVAGYGFPRSGRIADVIERGYPVAAVDALNRPGVRVFAHDAWSGLVIDRAWPNARVFIDLRWDFYGSELSERYGEIARVRPEWKENLDAACTTHVLIRPLDPLAQALVLSPEWGVERTDEDSVTFVRRRPAAGCGEHPIPA